MSLLKKTLLIGTFSPLLFGCVPKSQISRTTISDQIKNQYGYGLSENVKPGMYSLPPSVDTANGISEDEAVSMALYNNAQYQTDLVQISIAHADLIDAGVISNPLLRYLLPTGGLNVTGYINFGFDFLWQRPRRVAFARAEIERTAENLVQKGYTVIRDVQTGFADFQFAKDSVAILAENAKIRGEIARLNNIRFTSGEISELEASTSKADSAAATDEFLKAILDTILRTNRLNTLLGYSPDTSIAFESTSSNFIAQKISQSEFLNLAYQNQPELRSAQMAINSAASKIGWERSRIVSFMATIGYDHIPPKGGPKLLPNAFQPGIQMELPGLNNNQGKIARAKAELELASYNYIALRRRIANDVADAYARYEQTYKSYVIYNTSVLPSLEDAVRLVRVSFQRGDISYLPVLEAMRQLVNGKLRKAEIEAELRRSISQLNYTIGRKIEIQ
jgi:cobalt-zinc-cadmium efflux system outer membrane protein